jgi:hypothetical protein
VLLRSTTVVPLWSNQATADNLLQSSSDHLDPTPSITPPSTSSPTARTPPRTPTSACRRSPPPQRSLPVRSTPLFGRQTGPSPHRLAPRPLHRRPPAAHLSDFTGNSPVPTGEKASPILSQAERLRWARPLRSGWAEHCRGSPNEQCCMLFSL